MQSETTYGKWTVCEKLALPYIAGTPQEQLERKDHHMCLNVLKVLLNVLKMFLNVLNYGGMLRHFHF